ncbi:MAG: nitrous oxide-stimulated promoter family protein [Clostridiales bacterium]|nr:nitrous oxide-stimulated promoter family protein [Clostridiales bacterium]
MVSKMIEIYCRKNHNTKRGELCSECKELNDYARLRSDKCPFMKTKTFCFDCSVHCYKPEMKEKIRRVMRFSGPRMIFYSPAAAIRHLFEQIKKKFRLKNK